MYEQEEIARVEIFNANDNTVVKKYVVHKEDEAIEISEGNGSILIQFGCKSDALLAKQRYVDEATDSDDEVHRKRVKWQYFLPRCGAYSLNGHRFVVHFKGQVAD
jgi:hypothetical protein